MATTHLICTFVWVFVGSDFLMMWLMCSLSTANGHCDSLLLKISLKFSQIVHSHSVIKMLFVLKVSVKFKENFPQLNSLKI